MAIKNEGTEIHFLSDALVIVASLDLKVPISLTPIDCVVTHRAIQWIEIYPVDSAILRLSNRGQVGSVI